MFPFWHYFIICLLFSAGFCGQDNKEKEKFAIKRFKNGCEVRTYMSDQIYSSDVYCFDLDSFNFDELRKSPLFSKSLHSYCLIRASKILDSSFRMENLEPFNFLRFQNIIGFDINTSFVFHPELNPNYSDWSSIFFFYSKFKFYLNEKPIESCSALLKANLTRAKSFFQLKHPTPDKFGYEIGLYNINFPKPVCPLVFQDAFLHSLAISPMVNSFYKRNVLTFHSDVKIDRFNSTLKYIVFDNLENVVFDSTLLHPDVFANTRIILFDGLVKSIGKDVFRSMKKLSLIFFDLNMIEKLIHKGTKWISSINFDLDVNMSNQSDVDQNHDRLSIIAEQLTYRPKSHILIRKLDPSLYKKTLTNEDFCLFKDFPFNQMVVFTCPLYFDYYTDVSCTKLWLAKHAKAFRNKFPLDGSVSLMGSIHNYLNKMANKSNKECEFAKRLELCKKENFNFKSSIAIVEYRLVFLFIEFLIFTFTILTSILGIFSNLFVIYIISIKDNQKHLEAKHYAYMRLVSVYNILMLIINILSPIYYCQPYEGLFCSSIKTEMFTQYFQIWVGEFLMSLFRFMANFSYVGFSISRLSLIGTDHSKFVKSFPECSILVTQIISMILSVLLSTIKIFVYKPIRFILFHDFKKETNPFRFDRNPVEIEKSGFETKSRVINIFNLISDLSNYVVFTILFLALDIALLLKLKKTLENRMNKNKKENNSVVFRTIISVILYACFSIVLRLPATVKSLVDAMHFNSDFRLKYVKGKIDIFYDHICIAARFCETYQKLVSFLFTISLTGCIFFYYMFDKKFLISFKIAFSRLFSSKEAHKEFVQALEKQSNKR